MDITLLVTVATLVLGALGVIATLAAPRLSRSAKIYAEVADISPIRQESPASSVEIKVSHNGVVVDRPVFLVSATVENTGSVDVIERHFLEPLAFAFPVSVEVLSVEAEAANGVRPVASHVAQSINLKWLMLKPREKIDLKAIIASSEPVRLEELRRQVSTEIRLVDVQTGRGFWKSNPWLVAAIAFFLAASVPLAGLALFYLVPVRHDLVVTQLSNNRPVSVERSDGKLRLCVVHDRAVVLAQCRRTTPAEVTHLLESAYIGSGYTGLEPAFLWLAIVPLLYAVLGALNARRARLFLRVFGLDRETYSRRRPKAAW